MNAEQFTLPNELKPNEQLPFTWKWADERKSKKQICSISNYFYKPGDFNYRVRHPLVVARYHRNRWIKTDKWNLGRQRRV